MRAETADSSGPVPPESLGMALLVTGLLLLAPAAGAGAAAGADRPPNIVHVVGDDIGYDDIGAFGAKDIPTPNLDRLARQGMRLTRFYAPSPLCTPTRAAILTGSYAPRVGLPDVLFPFSKTGLADSEITIAELLKGRGYATALVGKWHLGHQAAFLPTRHGFDRFFGIPYPNDHEPVRVIWEKPSGRPDYRPPPMPLYRDDRVIEEPADLVSLPHRITVEAVRFIRENKDRPFYLHLAPIETHTPNFVSPRFAGFTACGAYCDAVHSVDWTIGEIDAVLQDLGLEESTLVVYSSDNGPLLDDHADLPAVYGRHGDTNEERRHELRGGKGSVWEGGVRVGAVARWKGRIPPGSTSDEVVAGFDLYTTFARVAGAEPPADRVIDGRDIRPILFGEPGARSPHEALYYYRSEWLGAVRSGRWKLVFGAAGGFSAAEQGEGNAAPAEALYDLETDPGERRDVLAAHPDVVIRLRVLAERARDDIGDAATGRAGRNRRPSARVD